MTLTPPCKALSWSYRRRFLPVGLGDFVHLAMWLRVAMAVSHPGGVHATMEFYRPTPWHIDPHHLPLDGPYPVADTVSLVSPFAAHSMDKLPKGGKLWRQSDYVRLLLVPAAADAPYLRAVMEAKGAHPRHVSCHIWGEGVRPVEIAYPFARLRQWPLRPTPFVGPHSCKPRQ